MAGQLGVRTPGDPATPRALDDSKNSSLQTAEKSAKCKGLIGKMSEFPCETAHQQPKHPLRILLQITRGEHDAESTSGSEYRIHVYSSKKHPGRRRICIHCRAKHARAEAPVVAQQRALQHHTKELDLWNSTVLCTVCTVQRQREPTGISTNLSRNWIRSTSNFSSMDCWNL